MALYHMPHQMAVPMNTVTERQDLSVWDGLETLRRWCRQQQTCPPRSPSNINMQESHCGSHQLWKNGWDFTPHRGAASPASDVHTMDVGAGPLSRGSLSGPVAHNAHSHSLAHGHTPHLYSPQGPGARMNDSMHPGSTSSHMTNSHLTSSANTNGNSVGTPSTSVGHGSPPLIIPQPVKPSSKPTKTYHCKMCDQMFDTKSDLLLHSQHVHKQDPKPYKCPSCGKCFANSSYLSQHSRIHSGIKPYKCQVCERKFTQLCHLQQHMRTHTGEKPYKCQHPGCGKAFSQLSNLQSHSRSHMTDKPYRCNSCYKCFTDEHSLREHIPKHSETKHLKTHICHICGKSYTQETYLTRHMTKHSYDSSGRGHVNIIKQEPPNISQVAQQMSERVMSEMEAKPPLENPGHPGLQDNSNKQSAFMPLTHSLQGPNILNNFSSGVPSNYAFPTPRLPTNPLNSPLSHLASVHGSVSPARFFPLDRKDAFQERNRMGMTGMSGMSSMAANSLLSLQHIKDYTAQAFSKSEPSSPMATHLSKEF